MNTIGNTIRYVHIFLIHCDDLFIPKVYFCHAIKIENISNYILTKVYYFNK